MALDRIDYKILRILEKDSNTSLQEIGRQVGIFSPSAISRRIKHLRDLGVIKKYGIGINNEELGLNFLTVTLVRAKYDRNYIKEVSDKIGKIRGVVSVYFLLGDIDFVLTTVSRTKEDYEMILDSLTEIVEIERTDSRTVLKIFKEGDYSSVLDLLISGD